MDLPISIVSDHDQALNLARSSDASFLWKLLWIDGHFSFESDEKAEKSIFI
jgi:hypothetical protein